MSDFKVGFGKVNINPPLGIGLSGYYIPRFAKGFLDDLEIRALAFECGDKRALMISVDVCFIDTPLVVQYCKGIEKATGVSMENILLSATHTHTGALLVPSAAFEADENVINRYAEFVGDRLIDASQIAFTDLKPAKVGYAVGKAPEKVAYIRRYKMKDGSTMTCPPINDPNIDHPIGELDKRVNILRFDRKNAENIVLVNFGLHADTVNGEFISADWPGWMHRTVEKAIDGTKSIFFSGAAGDVGSTHVFPDGGDMNDTEISFDNEMKSPGMARFVGRALAGTVLQVYDKVKYIEVDDIDVVHRGINVPSNVPSPEEIPLAHKYKKLHDEGRDSEIPYSAMELTTVVAEALRMCRLEYAPKEFTLDCIGLRLGEIAFVGLPGEPFTEIGVRIKDSQEWELVIPCTLTNGYEGYFPMKSAYDEGGYEARTSNYKSDVSERLIEGGKEILNILRKS